MKKVLFLLFLTLSFSISRSQIVFNGSTTGSGTGVSSLTYAKTIAAGNNRLLVVGVTTQDKAISSVKWNTLSLTQFTIGTRNSMRVALYYIALGSSASPTTANVVVTLAGGTDTFSGAADYSGVWQTPPLQSPAANQAKSTTPSVTFTSVTSHKAVSLMGCIAANPTANGSGQTQYWSFSGSHSNRATEKNGAASITMSHTISANEDWVMLGGTMLDYSVVLPIELLKFEATAHENQVDLNWTTASEINNDYFTVERSKDAINFEACGTVDGAGTSLVQLNYKLTDVSPYHDISYYRLKQTDFDGTYKYSNTIAINIKNVEILNFFPNPTTSQSNVVIVSPSAINIEFFIYSSDGKIVNKRSETLQQGVNIVNLDVTNYSEGSYIFSVVEKDKILSKKQFLVK